MGPKTAKVVEKVVQKDEGQVFYVNIKLTAVAPLPPAPVPAAPAPAAVVTPAAPAEASPAKPAAKSPTKGAKEPAPAPAAAPAPVVVAAPTEEIQEQTFELVVNLLCRADIVVDYIRRQFAKVIQDKLAAEDPEKKICDAMRTKLKDLQTELTNKTSADIVLRDGAGVDVVFKEVCDCCWCYVYVHIQWRFVP